MGGAVEVEPSADVDVGGDDVPSASAVVPDVARGVGEDGVVGAEPLGAVRVDVGYEVRTERLAVDLGGINLALVDGDAVGERLVGLDADAAGV